MSLIRVLIGVGGAALLAIPIHHFSIFAALGPALVAFFVNLLWFGWAMGLMIAALVLRLGLGAESLAWALIFLIQPLSGVYYPITTLPAWLQPIAWTPALGPDLRRHARGVVRQHLAHRPAAPGDRSSTSPGWRWPSLVFLLLFRSARNRGLLLQVGEYGGGAGAKVRFRRFCGKSWEEIGAASSSHAAVSRMYASSVTVDAQDHRLGVEGTPHQGHSRRLLGEMRSRLVFCARQVEPPNPVRPHDPKSVHSLEGDVHSSFWCSSAHEKYLLLLNEILQNFSICANLVMICHRSLLRD